jgi:two-component system sensor histidine kinase AlgZ
MHAPAARRPVRPQSPLPDFCSWPILFALLVVAALTVALMGLAPESTRGWDGFSMGMLLAEWTAALTGVALCKMRPLLQRLPGRLPYAGVWFLMIVITAIASTVAQWFDGVLELGLIRHAASSFIRDNVLIAALLGFALLRYFYVLAEWQARLAAVANAQVEALQARIRPHFLFNSMNTVAALVRVDPAGAERTIEDLSELFRAALGQHATRDGTLGEELQLVERYLAIEQLRLGDRLSVRRELDTLPSDMPLPRLLLQPLVENAVRHGVQPLREGGEIILRGHCEAKAVIVEIDNPLSGTPVVGGNGHGLDNVRQRVTHRFGPSANVEAGPRGDRFVVRLRLPMEERDARPDRR